MPKQLLPQTKANLRRAAYRGRFRVFAYGSLKEGRRRHWARGSLYLRETGQAAVDFQGKGLVAGELLYVDLEGLVALDRREGHPQVYCRELITLRSGAVAWGYQWSRGFDGLERVTDGVWRFEHLQVWRARYTSNPLWRRAERLGKPLPEPPGTRVTKREFPPLYHPSWDDCAWAMDHLDD